MDNFMNQKSESYVGLKTAAVVSVACLAAVAFAYFVRQGALFILIGVGAGLAGYGIWLIIEAKRTYRWTKSEGVIRHVKVAREHDFTQDEPLFRVTVKFAFHEGEQKLISEKIHFSSRDEQFIEESESQSVAERFRAGQKVPVYLDPRRHGVAILEPGVSERVMKHYYGVAGSGLLVFAISTVLLWWMKTG